MYSVACPVKTNSNVHEAMYRVTSLCILRKLFNLYFYHQLIFLSRLQFCHEQEQKYTVKFCVKLGEALTDTLRFLGNVYGEETMRICFEGNLSSGTSASKQKSLKQDWCISINFKIYLIASGHLPFVITVHLGVFY